MRWIILFSLAILALIIYFANPFTVANVILASNKWFLIAALSVSVLSLLIKVLKWKILLSKAGFLEIFPVQSLGTTISNFTPGKIAEPVKAMILRAKTGIPASVSLSSIIWERIMDLTSLLIFSILAIGLLAVNSRIYFLSILVISFFVCFIIFILSIVKSEKLGMKIFSFAKKFPIIRKINDKFVYNFYKTKIKRKALILSFMLTFLMWFLEGIIFYFSLRAVGIDLHPLVVVGIFSLSTMIALASFLPGGLGSMELVMVFLLGMNGATGSLAVGAVLISRFASFWFNAMIGYFSFLYLRENLEKIF